MGKYDYSRNIYFTKPYGNYNYYCHKQLIIKPTSITHGKATHLVDLSPYKHINKAQLTLAGPHTHKSSRMRNTWTIQLKFSKKRNAWSSLPSSHNLSKSDQNMDTCPTGEESFFYKLKFHQSSSDIKLKMMWQKAGKAEKASASRCFSLLQHT